MEHSAGVCSLEEIRSAIPATTRLHILGFARADDIASFGRYAITSFDTSSPLIRAFKDQKRNYYLPAGPGKLRYYSAIRVPQSLENLTLQRLVKRGVFSAEDLVRLEREALAALRAYDRREADLDCALDAVLAYNAPLVLERPYDACRSERSIRALAAQYAETLRDRPWTRCRCAVCAAVSIEVIIFRASNRNKRRGIHNLGVYKTLVDQFDACSGPRDDPTDLFGRQGAAE